MEWRPIESDPELLALLTKAKGHVMSPHEIAAQRRSWVVGEMMLADDSLTREDADERYDQLMRSLGYSPSP
jgi:hypothetical protein